MLGFLKNIYALTKSDAESHNYGNCIFECEITTGPDCDSGVEVRKVEDPALLLRADKGLKVIALSDFRNEHGDTIAEVLRDREYDFTLGMVKNAEKRGY